MSERIELDFDNNKDEAESDKLISHISIKLTGEVLGDSWRFHIANKSLKEGIRLDPLINLGKPFEIKIEFKNCNFQNINLDKLVTRNQQSLKIKITFTECNYDEIKYTNPRVGSLIFDKCVFQQLTIDNTSVNTILENCLGKITIKGNRSGSELPILYSNEYVGKDTSLSIHIINSSRIRIEDSSSDKITINELMVDRFGDKSSLSVKNIKVKKLSIYKVSRSAKMHINEIQASSFSMREVFPDESAKIVIKNVTSLSQNSNLSFDNVDIRNVYLFNIDFAGFKIVYIKDSSLLTESMYSCSIPERIVVSDKNSQSSLKQEYEYFRQIMMSYMNIKDDYRGLIAKAKLQKKLRQFKTLDRIDRFILWLNDWSNGNGLSVKRGFRTVLLASIISYILILFSIEDSWNKLDIYYMIYHHYFFKKYWNAILLSSFYNNLDLLFIILNPLHRVSELKESLGHPNNFTSFIYVSSFLSRVLISWSYYQFIAAFRKFGKKNAG